MSNSDPAFIIKLQLRQRDAPASLGANRNEVSFVFTSTIVLQSHLKYEVCDNADGL